jgi:hypothetical protein
VYLGYNKDSSVNTNLQVCNNVEDLANISVLIEKKKNSFDAAQKNTWDSS